MTSPRSEVLQQRDRARVRFLLAEIDAGLTFLSIAGSASLPNRREHFLCSAQEVYTIVLRLMPRVEHSPDEELELNTKIQALRNGLLAAGHSLSPE